MLKRLLLMCVITAWGHCACAAPLLTFDDFALTPSGGDNASSAGWTYSIRTAYDSNSDMWTSTTPWPAPDADVSTSIYRFINQYNNSHMGWTSYGFMEVDDAVAFSGKSLKMTITGGKNTANPDGLGTPTFNRAEYLTHLGNSIDPLAHDVIGQPYLYVTSTDAAEPYAFFPSASGANQMTAYVYLPPAASVGSGGYAIPAVGTFQVGPFTGTGSNHWYHNYYLNGDGWAKIVVDVHPQHNNAWASDSDTPYPSWSTRDLPATYIQEFYRFYMSATPEGVGAPPTIYWIDNIEFTNSAEPQNNETIASPGVVYHNDGNWEISFNDKYRNTAATTCTYEVRYSFSPITNANWAGATPVNIQAHAGLTIEARSDGKFDKHWAGYPQVWAPFRLQTGDEAAVVTGTTVYFAVKDIGNLDVNGDPTPIPNDSLTGSARAGGRKYDSNASELDWAGDSAVLSLVKLIDYTVPQLWPAPAIDADGDGFHVGLNDCNDADPAIHPGAVENCSDSIDNDCDTLIDSADPDCGVAPTCSDAIQNQGETGVDCGGPCTPCFIPTGHLHHGGTGRMKHTQASAGRLRFE